MLCEFVYMTLTKRTVVTESRWSLIARIWGRGGVWLQGGRRQVKDGELICILVVVAAYVKIHRPLHTHTHTQFNCMLF